MKKLAFLLVLLAGCTWGRDSCPIAGPDDKDGLYVRDLGTVAIGNESCEIIETYQKTCSMRSGFNRAKGMCNGDYVYCDERILTRLTKCPSKGYYNTISYSMDKFHREKIN